MSDLFDLIRDALERPAEGLLVGAITIFVAFVVYFLRRHDDGKPVKWPMAIGSLLSAAICLIVGITAFFKPAPWAPMPATPGTNAPGSSVTARPIYPTRRTYRVHLTSSPYDSPPTDAEFLAATKCKDKFPSDAFVLVTPAVVDRQLASVNQCLLQASTTNLVFIAEGLVVPKEPNPSSSAGGRAATATLDPTPRAYQVSTRSLSNDGRMTPAEFRAGQKCLSTLPSNAFRFVTQAVSDGQIDILNQCLREAGQVRIVMEAQVIGTSD